MKTMHSKSNYSAFFYSVSKSHSFYKTKTNCEQWIKYLFIMKYLINENIQHDNLL